MTEDQTSLHAFADRDGTVANPRETSKKDDADDGHCPYADPEPDHWTTNWDAPTPHPAGSWAVVLDPDEVKPKPTGPDTVQRGVYICDKHQQYEGLNTPPLPTEASDAKLKEAAEAGLAAAASIAEHPSEIVLVSSGAAWGSLNFADATQSTRDIEELHHSGDWTSIPTEDVEHDLFEGFAKIRRFGTPAELYSRYEEPRLRVSSIEFPTALRHAVQD
jgi:hypothetical protein